MEESARCLHNNRELSGRKGVKSVHLSAKKCVIMYILEGKQVNVILKCFDFKEL